jgi:lipoate-protein ligase A
MDYFDLTFPTPHENVACDEVLLHAREREGGSAVLRCWDALSTFVVTGYSNDPEREVYLDACREASIPVLRRETGGGAVVQMRGCLNYALVLPLNFDERLHTIVGTNAFIMERHRHALQQVVKGNVTREGFTDLAIDGRKFSGSAQRRTHNWILFHGCILLEADLAIVERLLRFPSRQPSYRAGRAHGAFLTNCSIGAEAVKEALCRAWGAAAATTLPLDQVRTLARQRATDPKWTIR